ncbi:MAG: Cysteine desulfurase CsdA [Alphaproteobacteria bacterium MarineAlpha3_Bin5]|nr:hypothetical protein [Magnetovibrio sp.]PPR77080.1 MAG: Cysteine desulfurase CsdA [Alphaproteobacteria bacterium MarineAlpha3_Bin5]
MDCGILDLDFVRAQFPDKCWEIAFFENAGGSFVPNTVIERMAQYMTDNQVQPGSTYPMAQLAENRIMSGYQLMADMMGVAADEVVIGASTSMNIYVLSKALRPLWKEGDQVIVSLQNHEANSGPWRRLSDTGIEILDWPVNPDTGELESEMLENLLTDRTRLVSFPHTSNITGGINDVATITRQAHDTGAMVCVDGVAYAPHRALEVKKWDVDFYVFSFYKLFGPHIGCLYGKKEQLLKAHGQYHYFIGEDETSKKLNPAGPCHETIASLAGIADYFNILANHHFHSPANDLNNRVKKVFRLFSEHEEKLAKEFLEFLLSKHGVRLIGRPKWQKSERAPTFSFVVEGRKSAEIPKLLVSQDIGLGHGNFYATRLIEAVGITDLEDGVIRVSMAHYTSHNDLERLISGLDAIL